MNTYMVFIDLKLKTKCSPGAYTMMLKCQSRGQPPNLQPRQPGMTYLVWTCHQDFTNDHQLSSVQST